MNFYRREKLTWFHSCGFLIDPSLRVDHSKLHVAAQPWLSGGVESKGLDLNLGVKKCHFADLESVSLVGFRPA